MKKNKKQKTGFIRTGAVVPFIIVMALIIGFNILFLDTLLASFMEKMGTKLVGAEVNVSSVNTSFKDLSIDVNRIQVTNKETPERNLFEIGNVHFGLMWDALLRAKFVIEESSIKDILVDTKRSSKGYVVPPDAKAEDEKPSETILNAKKEFKGNIFGDIASLLGGDSTKDIAANIEGELKSKKRYEELNSEIKVKEKEVSKMLKDLPNDKDLKDLEKRAKAINVKNLTNFSKAAKTLKEINTVKKDIDQTIKAYDNAQKRVSSEIKYLENSTKEIDKLVNEDINSIQKRVNLPSLDTKSISNVLFGEEVTSKMASFEGYFKKAKKFMPPPKDERSAPEVVATARGEGVNYQFGTPTSYPLFWLKLASVNSKTDQGNMSGAIKNVTTDQRLANAPMLVDLRGDFTKQDVQNIRFQAIFDHRFGINDEVKIGIGKFPVREKKLSDSKDVTFKVKEANGQSQISAKLQNEKVNFEMNNVITSINYEVDAKSKEVKSLLNGIAGDANRITLDAKSSGTFKDLDWKISTNLANVIKASVERQLQAKINEAKAKIKSQVEGEIKSQKDKFNSELAKLKEESLGKISKDKGDLNKLLKGIKL